MSNLNFSDNLGAIKHILKCRSILKDRFMPILSDLNQDRNHNNRAYMISDLLDEVDLLADELSQAQSKSNDVSSFLTELHELAGNESLGGSDSTSEAITTATQIVENYYERKTDA
jgi:hypothetical protein